MKINDSIKKNADLAIAASQPRPGKSAGKADAAASPSGNVTLSSEVRTLAGQVSGASVFDANKVEAIKAAIASGQFQVNAERVADGLINTVKDLLSARKD